MKKKSKLWSETIWEEKNQNADDPDRDGVNRYKSDQIHTWSRRELVTFHCWSSFWLSIAWSAFRKRLFVAWFTWFAQKAPFGKSLRVIKAKSGENELTDRKSLSYPALWFEQPKWWWRQEQRPKWRETGRAKEERRPEIKARREETINQKLKEKERAKSNKKKQKGSKAGRKVKGKGRGWKRCNNQTTAVQTANKMKNYERATIRKVAPSRWLAKEASKRRRDGGQAKYTNIWIPLKMKRKMVV